MENLSIIGGGGHAAACLGNLLDLNIIPVGFYDDNPKTELLGIKRLGNLEDAYLSTNRNMVIGIGDLDYGRFRTTVIDKLVKSNINIIGFCSRSVICQSKEMELAGLQIFPFSFIGFGVRIGQYSVLNTRCTLEHESEIGSNVILGPNSLICGKAKVGDRTIIGASATILPKVQIGPGNIIGAQSLVRENILGSGKIYAGIPAREIGSVPI